MKQCSQCHLIQTDDAQFCTNCGATLEPTPISSMTEYGQRPRKKFFTPRITAGFIAIFLGSFGIHKLIFRKGTKGISWIPYLLFCWTLIPTMIGIIEGIRYFCLTDAQFYEIMHTSYVPPRPPAPPVSPNLPTPPAPPSM